MGNLAYMKTSHVALIGWLCALYNVSIHPEMPLSLFTFLTIDQTCDATLKWANEQLMKAGLRTVQTFDLKDARAGSHDCVCPHHGTPECDCQMVVLLVYGSSNEPATLILHGNQRQTQLSFADMPTGRNNTELAKSIQQQLGFQA
jgi:hypothetical protein